MKALVILSGGQDSTTCLFWAKHGGRFKEVHAISFRYGQRHSIELDAAKKVAKMAGVNSYEVIDVRGCLKSSSPLISAGPLRDAREPRPSDEVEPTFVPMRNGLFLTIAANRAYALGCNAVVIGVSETDSAGYRDCTANFLFETYTYINEGLGIDKGADAIDVVAPLMFLKKADSIRLAMDLPGCMDALAYSHTNYAGVYPPISNDHANLLRAEGFREAGVADPLVLRAHREGLMDLPDTPNYDSYR